MNYGSWIKPDGEVVDVVDQCSHTRFCSYSDAYDEGWIATVNAKDSFCARWTPEFTPRAAIKALRRMVKESDYNLFYFETLLDGQKTLFDDGDNSKQKALFFLNKLLSRSLKE